MKQLKEVMTQDIQVIHPNASLKEVAIKMKELNCGAMPVCENDKLLGMVTDRDIVIRTLADNRDPNTTYAKEVMSSPIIYFFEDQEIDEAARLMEVKKIRRLVILNRKKRLVGIVSLGDLAVRTGSGELSGEILGKVSEPYNPQQAA